MCLPEEISGGSTCTLYTHTNTKRKTTHTHGVYRKTDNNSSKNNHVKCWRLEKASVCWVTQNYTEYAATGAGRRGTVVWRLTHILTSTPTLLHHPPTPATTIRSNRQGNIYGLDFIRIQRKWPKISVFFFCILPRQTVKNKSTYLCDIFRRSFL